MQSADLSGSSVLVAGAGLAGLAAALDLVAMGASVTVIEARDRVGGRVRTIHQPFLHSQHAEAGGDFIDESHTAIRELAQRVGLKLARILRTGFSYALQEPSGKVQIVRPARHRGWNRLGDQLSDLTATFKLAERRWDSPIAENLARFSVAEWLDRVRADDDLRTTAIGLRGFFLADPEELSLLALVDQFSAAESPVPPAFYRVEGGNERLTNTLAGRLGDRVRCGTELVAVTHRTKGVRASMRSGGRVSQIQADYMILALPAVLLRRIPITPALPSQQHEAIARLRYGRGTKTLLQFSKRFWRAPGRPRGLGSALPFGAAWEGNEEQRGRQGILSLLAGGSAGDATRNIVRTSGMPGLVRTLDWLGSPNAELLASHQTVWEDDPWSRGGYAFFDPSFDPAARGWLARPRGPLFFAGEHTSFEGQGYMNGAVESGRRAAAEIVATHELGG